MSRKYGTLVSLILDCLDLDVPLMPLESPYDWLKRKRSRNVEKKRYQETIWRMSRQGYLNIVLKNNKKFLKLTQKGYLEHLLEKAEIKKTESWDGKWRLLIFDIPENSRDKRDQFRSLLKRYDFVKLQNSVFIHPYPLNQEAISYLKETGLIDFIRILRVDAMDDDRDLRKRFGLQNSRP